MRCSSVTPDLADGQWQFPLRERYDYDNNHPIGRVKNRVDSAIVAVPLPAAVEPQADAGAEADIEDAGGAPVGVAAVPPAEVRPEPPAPVEAGGVPLPPVPPPPPDEALDLTILGNIRPTDPFPHAIIRNPKVPRADGLPTVVAAPLDGPDRKTYREGDGRLGRAVYLNALREIRGQRVIPS